MGCTSSTKGENAVSEGLRVGTESNAAVGAGVGTEGGENGTDGGLNGTEGGSNRIESGSNGTEGGSDDK